MIPTPTLKFWGFKEHPFADNILRDELMPLFVDREDELSQVFDALGRSRVVGVHGNLGVGKSSFLHKLCKALWKDGISVAYVHLNADSEDTLYRELLAELLVLMQRANLSLKTITEFRPEEEAQRLHASVTSSRGADFGAKLAGIGGKFIEDRSVSVEAHTESSARESIRSIFDALNGPLVVVFDDFEKLRYEASGKTRDYFPILSRFVSTLEELLNRKKVSFVLSMDNQVEGLIAKEQRKGGQFAFSLNHLCPIPNLTLDHLWSMVEVRLKTHGWKGKTANFMTDSAFYALAIASSNHPRKAVNILAEAMWVVANRKEANERVVDDQAIREGAARARIPLDEKDWVAVEYLLEHGESANDDDALRQCLGYKRTRNKTGYHTSVDRKLNAIAASLRLEFQEAPSGNTTKKVLRLPKVIRQ
jgi:KaiC/GvpD/RAD55 family RecA-like ATPase